MEKVKEWNFNSTLNEVIWPKRFSNSMHELKSAILAIFQTGAGWPCTVIFALGADEFLAMLEGKIREAPFFKVGFGNITVCTAIDSFLLLLGTSSM